MTTAPFGCLRVGAACPPVAVACTDGNAAESLRALHQARERGVQILVLPELGLAGHTAGDLFFSLSTLVAGAERALGWLLRETASLPMVVAVGLPVALDGRLFNAAALIQGGRLLGAVPKTFLPGYGEYYEERWFSSSREATSQRVRLAGAEVPFGTDLLFGVEGEPGGTLAFEICEDLWAPISPRSRQAVAGATLLLHPSPPPTLAGGADQPPDT